MTTIYQTKEGDLIDWVAWKYYGNTDNRVVELILAANPGLADRGPILPANVLVTIPDAPAPGVVQGVRLWD